MRIILQEYDPGWKELFSIEKRNLENIFPSKAIIEHIGSTAVEGLIAKPVIDIMIGLADFSGVNSYIPILQKLYYIYVPEYELTMPFRRYFSKETKGKSSYHIHMVAIASEFWKRHLAFRNYLRQHEAAKKEYAELKLKLAKQDWADGNEYADAKTEFIRRIEKMALRID